MAACLPRPQWLRACPAPWALPTRGAVGRGLYKMRFRSKIVDVSCLSHFTRIVNTITKLTKACTLRLTDDKLYFILSDKVANGGVSMWCELQQMEGVSTEHNDIYLEVTPENLSRALKTAQNAKAVKIKLTKKHCPCLTVAVELPSLSSSSRIVTHDIPVGVIPRKLWSDFREPGVPDFDVSIYLPVLKTMKSVVERMKNISNYVIIEANRNGEMNLKIETDLVSVTTHFKDLGNPPWVSDDASQGSFQDRDPEAMAEARVDIRKLLQFLAGQQVNPTKAICNIVNNKIVHFILLHEDVSLQYFIPALA
ncbi:checkpoint protein HUS1 isoform X2 [Rhinatrema bivittatum]|uniref:checkpoint protein HUS1 isoform X2 n=1 Tax=Rhinatrema bivittatum TaxID=194408 RepID=UPI00112C7B85|nr:checkpoint protein HUS1 isoform X2 [Rhinatrema bivittatum]